VFIGIYPVLTAFYFAQIYIFLQNFCAVFVPFLTIGQYKKGLPFCSPFLLHQLD
jgi:hypothetical protein